MVRPAPPKTLIERLNSGLVLALAWCIAVWMVMYGLIEGFVIR